MNIKKIKKIDMCPQPTLRTHLAIHVQRDKEENKLFPLSLLRIYSISSVPSTRTEKGKSGKRQQMSIVTVPMPDYSSSPQTGGGCDLTRSTYVFPCIQDARHCWVVQLGPGQGKLNTVRFNMVSIVLANVQCCFAKTYPFALLQFGQNNVSCIKRTTKQTKEDKRERGREKEGNSSALFSMKATAIIKNKYEKTCISSGAVFRV